MGNRVDIMLAKPYEERYIKSWRYVILQPKVNGIRCRIYCHEEEPILYSSEGNIIQSMPHINSYVKEMTKYCSTLSGKQLDGELYIYNEPTTQRLNSIVLRKGVHVDHKEVYFIMFDVVDTAIQEVRLSLVNYVMFQTRDIVGKRYIIRLSHITSTVENLLANDSEVIRIFTIAKVEEGYEGIILRNPDAHYVTKRTSDLLKYKPTKRDTYKIIGMTEAISIDGIPKDMVGAFICMCEKSGEEFKVGTGPLLTEVNRINMWRSEDIIGKTLLVKYAYPTDRGVPFHPVCLEIID